MTTAQLIGGPEDGEVIYAPRDEGGKLAAAFLVPKCCGEHITLDEAQDDDFMDTLPIVYHRYQLKSDGRYHYVGAKM